MATYIIPLPLFQKVSFQYLKIIIHLEMGFCIYCNKNVYSNTTCPKCYRTVPKSTPSKTDNLSSRVTALFPEEKRLNQKSNTDKWQDTYVEKMRSLLMNGYI